jgi:hypothetical protein
VICTNSASPSASWRSNKLLQPTCADARGLSNGVITKHKRKPSAAVQRARTLRCNRGRLLECCSVLPFQISFGKLSKTRNNSGYEKSDREKRFLLKDSANGDH